MISAAVAAEAVDVDPTAVLVGASFVGVVDELEGFEGTELGILSGFAADIQSFRWCGEGDTCSKRATNLSRSQSHGARAQGSNVFFFDREVG